MERKRNAEKKVRQLERLTDAFRTAHMPPIPSDVQGWYTGVDEDGERPVQDADDL